MLISDEEIGEADAPELLKQPDETLGEWARRYMKAKGIELRQTADANIYSIDNPLIVRPPDTMPPDIRNHEEAVVRGYMALLLYADPGDIYCIRCFTLRREGWKNDCPYAPFAAAAQEQLSG